MKTKFVIAVLLIGAGWALLHRGPAHREASVPEAQTLTANPEASGAASPQTAKPKSARGYLSGRAPVAETEIDARSIRETLDLDSKALKTNAESAAYERALQDRTIIATAVKTLARVQEPRSLQQRRAEQWERMNAALFLVRALEWEENPSKADVQRAAKILILDGHTLKTNDVELRKSLAADRIELFAALKANERVYAQNIQTSATRDDSRKLIQFANNFYRLDDSRKN